ncbi:tandem-95 repeat protein [Mycolicibacterium arenosum]|uniref:Tandem-95 repeat protein n=1 Tax=Mycolicibacterium arenosum TaxID=2952157 RepID=A0ABT1M336_9MYCO|nr:Ig-like domain-containing protein [Mycolicibacterium sp. CAU 1645]MCP9273565.1 tandem-95 repeat protein [Mycolicibacterium sp. CAU 1645]
MYPTFTLTAVPLAADRSGYARFVGRIGALAVALGVGAAVATGHGVPIAHADDTNQESPAGEQPGDVQPDDGPGTAQTEPDSAPVVTVNGEPTDGNPMPAENPGGSVVPEMNVDSSGGYLEGEHGEDDETPTTGGTTTIVGSIGETSTLTTPPDTGPAETPAAPAPPAEPAAPTGNTAPTPTTEQPNRPVKPEHNDPQNDLGELTVINDGRNTPADAGARLTTFQPDAAATQSFSTLIAPQPNIIEPEQPSLLAGLLTVPGVALRLAATVAIGVLAPFLAPGPVLPPQPPVLWAVLAWVRREIQRTLWNQTPHAVDNSVTTSEDAAVTIDALANDTDFDEDGLAISDYTQPANGSVVLNPDGTFTYTPDADFNGVDSFQYAVVDTDSLPHFHGILRGLFNLGHQDVATVTITVNAVEDNIGPPVADDDAATVAEGGTVAIDVLTGDTDPDGNTTLDPTSVVVVTPPANGTVTVDPVTGVITYTHNGTETLTDTFTYTVEDTTGALSNTATVTITVTPVNDGAPVADNDAVTTDEDTPVDINVLGDDSDAEGSIPASNVSVVDGPSNGTASVNADGTVKYTPAADYNGPDSFTYTLDDGDPTTVDPTATVNISVAPVNDAPTVVTSTSTDNTTGKVTITVVVTDPDVGDAQTITLSPPANGTGSVGAVTGPTYDPIAQTYTYTAVYTPSPQARVNAYNTAVDPDVDSITVTVSDGVAPDVTTPVSVTISPLAAANGGTIATGGYPVGIAISADGERAYVANLTGTTVTVIDIDPTSPTYNQVVDTNLVTPGVQNIAVGNGPAYAAITPDGTRLYVTNGNSASVSVVDIAPGSPNRYRAIDTDGNAANGVTNIPVGNTPREIAISPDGTRAYVVNAGSHTVSVIDIDPTSVNYNKVVDVDPSTGGIDNVPVGTGPYAVAITPDGKRLFVTSITSTTVTVINVDAASPTRYQVIDANGAAAGNNIALSPSANPNGIAISPDGTRAYITNTNLDSVTVLDIQPGSPTQYQILDTNGAAAGVNIPVGDAPVGIKLNADGTRAYLVNSLGSTMTVIDIAPGSPTRYQVIDTNPTTAGLDAVAVANPLALALTPDGTRAYVSNTSAGTVTVIYLAGAADDGVAATTPISYVGASPFAALAHEGRIYVANNDDDTVTVIDATTNTIVDSDAATNGVQNITVGASPYALAASGSRVYVANSVGNSVTVIDTDTNTVIHTITNAGGMPSGLSVSGNRLYISNSAGTVTVVNTDDYSVIDTDGSTPGDQPIGLGAGPHMVFDNEVVGSRLYIADFAGSGGNGSVKVIDTVSNTVIDSIPLGQNPFQLLARGNRLYVTNISGDTVTVINTDTNTVVDTVPVGQEPTYMAIRGNRLYVSNFVDDTVTVINTDTNTVVDTNGSLPGDQPLTVSDAPAAMGIVGGTLYVFHFLSDTVTVIDLNTVSVL